MAVRSGDFNRQGLLQQRSVGRDTFGQELVDWTTVATPMMRMRPLSGRELELAKAINAETTHEAEMRYRKNINTAMRLVYQGRNFNIHSIIDLEMRHEVLQLSCGEGLDGG